MHTLRNLIVLATLVLTTLDLFHYFVVASEGWFTAGRIIFLSLGGSLAILGGTLIAHALLALWEGTSFVKGLVDVESETVSYGMY